MSAQVPQKSVLGRRLLLGAPLAVLALVGGGWALMLRRMAGGNFDPHSLPSQLIGKKVPDFSLPGLDGGVAMTGAELQNPGRPMLVNFFASWCVPCLEDAPMLNKLAKNGLPIWGITYKDKQADTQRFLSQNGNPYARIAVDQPGRVAIDWGVYGVPETYLIDAAGLVHWRFAGALTQRVVDEDLTPLLRRIGA
ncbi:DsbE family thiol:disulfide interchange protein [Acidisoma cellulosilytica]|uniref:DsbE family thiol:disulfide interchange protein n=1 Tax=Acidisoma cellulosilyticum TaxID=2802395 RepID=A0A963YXQ7_9PROT|nr:DsbE family thiol:disulfide interchange protein [Acidisoma cellulosilyticum]MCB8879103.1 DsbE family thiol:disulfide interchange protein [Acidisoma cellulosilyticum]